MTVSAQYGKGQEPKGRSGPNRGMEHGGAVRAEKRIFTVQLMQAWRKVNVNPLAAVRPQVQALWVRMATEHQKAWERSAADGAYRMVCWPSQSRLAAQLAVSVQTIRRWTRQLEAAGLIEVDHVSEPGKQTYVRRCHYKLVAPMRESTIPAQRPRKRQEPRGIARTDYVRKPAAPGVRKVDRAAIEATAAAERQAYIEKLAVESPGQAAAFQRIEQLRARQESRTPDTSTSEPARLAAEVVRLIPSMTMRKAVQMAGASPSAMRDALQAFAECDIDDMRNPAGYFIGIYDNIARAGILSGKEAMSHAA